MGRRERDRRASTSGTFYARFRRYLRLAGMAPTGIHVLRHTAAKLRRDAGESIEDVSAFLDHSSLAVTTVYLRRLEGQEDRAWRRCRGDWSLTLGGTEARRQPTGGRLFPPSAAIATGRRPGREIRSADRQAFDTRHPAAAASGDGANISLKTACVGFRFPASYSRR